jgi:hypothetical protein
VRVTIASLAILALLVVPGVAAAQGAGNGGADEYTEIFPGAGGNHPSNTGGGGGEPGEPSGGGSLTPSQIAALEAQGSDGAAAAALAQSTGPDANRGAGGASNGAAAGDANGSPADDSGGSGIPQVIGDLAGGSDDGMGPVLPIILVAAAIGALGFLIVRRGGGQAGRA